MKSINLKNMSARWLLCLLLALAVGGALVTSGCGAKEAEAKKEKGKKDKKKAAEEEEEAEEEEAAEEKESEKEKSKESAKNEKSKDADKKEEEGGESEEAKELWADLMKGNARFVEGKHSSVQLATMRKGLVEGQKPKVIILGCADSRVPPELLFDKNLGELFVVRVAGNVADPVTLGSIEYAVEHLGSKLIVLLGHESCGAVAAAVSGEEMPTRNIEAIVERIKPAFEGAKSCPIGGKANLDCVKLNVEHGAEDLLKQSAIIKKATKEGVAIIKAVYKLDTGEVERLD